MKIYQAYMDVPKAEKIALWYAGQPLRGLDRVADELIAALQGMYDWFSKALIKLDVPETRLILLFDPAGKPREMQILRFQAHDPHDFPKLLAELKALMDARDQGEGNGKMP